MDTKLPNHTTNNSMPSHQEKFATTYKHTHKYEVITDKTRGFRTLVARKNFAFGDILSRFYSVEESTYPNRYSVQVEEFRHIILYPLPLQYISHSCDPNVFFDTQVGNIICLKPIQVGDPITYFYPSTEWEMADAFLCQCRSEWCLGRIQGAKYLPTNILNCYELTRHIRRLKHLQ